MAFLYNFVKGVFLATFSPCVCGFATMTCEFWHQLAQVGIAQQSEVNKDRGDTSVSVCPHRFCVARTMFAHKCLNAVFAPQNSEF
jgi:hypothetical protein